MQISIIVRRLSRKAAALIAMLFGIAGPCSHAQAASSPDVPPPGLYQIDKDSNVVWPERGASMRQRDDGASGDIHNHRTLGGSRDVDMSSKGTGPTTHCILKHAETLPNAVLASNASCKNQPGMQTNGGFVNKAICASSVVTLTSHRIDGKTWEIAMAISTSPTSAPDQTASSGPDLRALRFMHQPNASAKEREELAQTLAKMSEIERGQANQAAKSMAFLNALEAHPHAVGTAEKTSLEKQGVGKANAAFEAVSKERWTRIADSCGATKRAGE